MRSRPRLHRTLALHALFSESDRGREHREIEAVPEFGRSYGPTVAMAASRR